MESWSAVMFTVSVRLLAPVLRLAFAHSIKGYPSHPPFTSHPRIYSLLLRFRPIKQCLVR